MDTNQIEKIMTRMQLSDEDFKSMAFDNFAKAKTLLSKKREDYGHLNLDIMGSEGIIPYLVSKVLRVYNLFNEKNQNFESKEDSLIDIMNYCNLALIYLDLENKTKE